MAVRARHDHTNEALPAVIRNLPGSQGGTGRHKCPFCAYSQGVGYAAISSRSETAWESCKHGSAAPRSLLTELPESQAGSGRHKCVVCAFQLGLGAAPGNTLYPEDLSTTEVLMEGAARQVRVNAYERNPVARLRCIQHYGTRCGVCEVEFEARYGDVGKGFIHVHHLRSIATAKRSYQVDPVKDLRPVCPNCHAMLHRKEPPFTIEELRARLR